MPDLAGEPTVPRSSCPADDHAAADADLAGQVDQVGRPGLGALAYSAEGGEVGVVVHTDREGRLASRSPSPATTATSPQRRFGREADAPSRCGPARDGEGQPDRRGAARPGRDDALGDQARDGSSVARAEAGDVERDPPRRARCRRRSSDEAAM